MKAVKESNGVFTMVSDEEIMKAQAMLARLEGIAVEPASAASLAGLARLVENGVIAPDETVVIVLTGHGLKDPQAMLEAGARRYIAGSPEEAVKIVLGLAES